MLTGPLVIFPCTLAFVAVVGRAEDKSIETKLSLQLSRLARHFKFLLRATTGWIAITLPGSIIIFYIHHHCPWYFYAIASKVCKVNCSAQIEPFVTWNRVTKQGGGIWVQINHEQIFVKSLVTWAIWRLPVQGSITQLLYLFYFCPFFPWPQLRD